MKLRMKGTEHVAKINAGYWSANLMGKDRSQHESCCGRRSERTRPLCQRTREIFGTRELEELETVCTSFEGLQLAVILEDLWKFCVY
jgi:hypothetical protein